MSLKPDRGEGGLFQPAPEGTHVGVCVSVVDLGVQVTKFGIKRQVFLTFELMESKMDDGRPFVVSKTFTNSLHEKASLRAMLEPWVGRKEIDAESFSLSTLAGRVALVTIGHREGVKGRFAEIMSIASIPKGMSFSVEKMVNPITVFDMDVPDIQLLERLPKWVRAKIEGQGTEEAIKAYDDKLPW